MLVMTAKVDKKKIAIVLACIIAAVALLFVLLGGNSEPAATTGAVTVASNDDRVNFLSGFGWEVTTSPVESGQVRIPEETTEVFDRYNALQKSQGYDLSQYAGKSVMRYVYKVNNYPGATEPVYATLLVYKKQIIGGDITNTAPDGTVCGFKKASPPAATLPGETTTMPTDSTQPTPKI